MPNDPIEGNNQNQEVNQNPQQPEQQEPQPSFQDLHPAKKTSKGYITYYEDDNHNVCEEYLLTDKHQDGKNMVVNGQKGHFFTSEPFDINKEFAKLAKELAAKQPALAPYLKFKTIDVLNDENQFINPTDPNYAETKSRVKNDLTNMKSKMSMSGLVGENAKYAEMMAYPDIATMLDIPAEQQQELIEKPEFAAIVMELAEKGTSILTRAEEYSKNLLPNGSDTSRYHEAMEDIAELLGKPGMVAHSEYQPIIQNGKMQFGTFVQEVEGHKLVETQEENIFLDKKHNPLKDGDAVRMLADQNILNYVTASNSMNMTDYTYQTDPNDPTKITNIIRQNAGNCFGVLDPENRENMDATTPMLEELKVISKSMAENVMNITEDKLKFVLSGKNMTEAQVNSCWDRVQKLQEAIKHPSPDVSDKGLTIVDDDKFGEINFEQLYTKKETLEAKNAGQAVEEDLTGKGYDKNIFNKAQTIRDQAKAFSNSRKVDKEAHGLDGILKFEQTGKFATERELSLHGLSSAFKEIDPPLLISSKEFRNMKSAMIAAEKEMLQFNQRLAKKGVPSVQDLKTLREKFAEVQKWSKEYVEKKDYGAKIKGRHGKERYDFVTKTLGYSNFICKGLDAKIEQTKQQQAQGGKNINQNKKLQEAKDHIFGGPNK